MTTHYFRVPRRFSINQMVLLICGLSLGLFGVRMWVLKQQYEQKKLYHHVQSSRLQLLLEVESLGHSESWHRRVRDNINYHSNQARKYQVAESAPWQTLELDEPPAEPTSWMGLYARQPRAGEE